MEEDLWQNIWLIINANFSQFTKFLKNTNYDTLHTDPTFPPNDQALYDLKLENCLLTSQILVLVCRSQAMVKSEWCNDQFIANLRFLFERKIVGSIGDKETLLLTLVVKCLSLAIYGQEKIFDVPKGNGFLDNVVSIWKGEGTGSGSGGEGENKVYREAL
jgi:hypothetical protein